MLETIFPRIPEVSWLDNICFFILILSALNWGAYGFYSFNLVDYIPDDIPLKQFVYGIVVLSGVKALFFWRKCLACSRIE